MTRIEKLAKVLTDTVASLKQNITKLSTSLRNKGVDAPEQTVEFYEKLPNWIDSIKTEKPEVVGKETITTNGVKTFAPPDGNVFSSFEVTTDTPKPKPEESYNKTYTTNGTYPIVPLDGSVINGGSIIVQTPVKEPESVGNIAPNDNEIRTYSPSIGVFSEVRVDTTGMYDAGGIDTTPDMVAIGQEFISRSGRHTGTMDSSENYKFPYQGGAPSITTVFTIRDSILDGIGREIKNILQEYGVQGYSPSEFESALQLIPNLDALAVQAHDLAINMKNI